MVIIKRNLIKLKDRNMLDKKRFPLITTGVLSAEILHGLKEEVQDLVSQTVTEMEISTTDKTFLKMYTNHVLERSFRHLHMLKTSPTPIKLRLYNGKIYFVSERGRGGMVFGNLLTATNPFTQKDEHITASLFDSSSTAATPVDVARSSIRYILGRLEQKSLQVPLMYVLEEVFHGLMNSIEG